MVGGKEKVNGANATDSKKGGSVAKDTVERSGCWGVVCDGREEGKDARHVTGGATVYDEGEA